MTVTELLSKAKKPLSVHEISERLQLSAAETKAQLDECYSMGLIVTAKGGKYAHPRIMGLKLCRAKTVRGNSAFASPADGGADYMLDMPGEQAFDGDLVFVRETRPGDKPRADLIYVVKRARTAVIGVLILERPEPHSHARKGKKGRLHYVPQETYTAALNDRHWPSHACVNTELNGAVPGDLCIFEVTRWPDAKHAMCVRVKQVIGTGKDMGARLSALCALNGIEEDFSAEALEEAGRLGTEPKPGDYTERLDLRGEMIFTIDGADAQDFDDAVSLEKTETGYLLGVHIADVSYYVTRGSAIDEEARRRGTSVYLPGRTIPMLPEALCNCLCSLMPQRDRLTFSAIMEMDTNGEVRKTTLKPSVIRSMARLTYDDVNRMLAGEPNTVPAELHENLRLMNELAHKLNTQRVRHGSLELDVPEPSFKLDAQGNPVEMAVRERGDAHRLIEEFMLAANRAVALHAEKTQLPFPYRIHEAPDTEKLYDLELLLAAVGKPARLTSSCDQSKLQAALDSCGNTGLHTITANMILRAMSKARYSEKNLGHFGLAFSDYCHFTSPIRRYPDLLAHRMLHLQIRQRLTEEDRQTLTGQMHTLTDEASQCEERAVRCERDGDKLMCTAYMRDHKGMVLPATVTKFLRKGILVQLDNTCEGLIPNKLTDDEYEADELSTAVYGRYTGRVIRLGERVSVKCVSADIDGLEIEFSLIGQNDRSQPRLRERKPDKRRR